MGSVILKCLVGGIAGILVWIVFEARAPHVFNDPAWEVFEQSYVTWLGIVIGAAIGAVTGWMQGGKRHLIRGLGLGALFGAIGIDFGHLVGSQLFERIVGPGLSTSPGALAQTVLARTIAFSLMGAGLGFAIGGSTFNFRRAVQGLVGGLLAGIIGGLTFDIVCQVTGPLIQQARGVTNGTQSEVGIVGRAFMALMLGAFIGLFIGLVERFARSAWLRLSLGRNEGREWSIDAAMTTIGRSEAATIPLFGDANVAPLHAQIQRQNASTYVLVDNGSPIGTYLNGQRIQAAPLVPGAMIQIGGFQLQFLMKNAPAYSQAPEALRSMQSFPLSHAGAIPQPNAMSPHATVSPGTMSASTIPPGSIPPGSIPPGSIPPGSLYGASSGTGSPAPAVSSQPTTAYSPVAVSPGSAHLVALDGPLSGQRFPVAAGAVLGRESNFVPMGYDGQASRRHAEFSFVGGAMQINDLGSTNGTFLNGQRIQSAAARVGDVVRIGSTSFRVEP